MRLSVDNRRYRRLQTLEVDQRTVLKGDLWLAPTDANQFESAILNLTIIAGEQFE
jgi:hypothetical protein